MALPQALPRTPGNPDRHCTAHRLSTADVKSGGTMEKSDQEPHLAFSKPNSLEWPFHGLLISHSCGSSKSQPLWLSPISQAQCMDPHPHSLWAPKMGGKLGNWAISTRLADTSDIFLTQSLRGRCSPLLWAVSATLSTSPYHPPEGHLIPDFHRPGKMRWWEIY